MVTRQKVVTLLLLSMLGVFGWMAAGRAESFVPSAQAPAQALAEAPPKAREKGKAGDTQSTAAVLEALVVVGLGWDVLAPGVLANGGTERVKEGAFAEQELEVRLQSVDDPALIERALALGGSDEEGADVAILPLPTLVAAGERLRALAPHAFFVTGWSYGRDALYAAGEPTVDGADAEETTRLVGRAGEPATYVSLTAFDLAGIDLGTVRLTAPEETSASTARWAAVDRLARDSSRRETGRRVVVTTAQAKRLVPYVAVVSEGFLRQHEAELGAFVRGWLTGVDRLAADVPAGARQVAAIDGAPGAAELLRRFGQIDTAHLRANVRWMGLSGRGAVTVSSLYAHSHSMWRGAGVLTTPAPSAPLVHDGIVAALARSHPDLLRPPAQVVVAEPDGDAPALIRHATDRGSVDEQELVDRLGFWAGVFERSAFRVSTRGRQLTQEQLVTHVSERYDVSAERFGAAQRPRGRTAVLIELLPVH